MEIIKSSLFIRQEQKLVKKGKLSKEQIDKTIEIFIQNPQDYRLRPHKITCKRDKSRRSITVIPKTAYRILYTQKEDKAILQQILHHDDYDRINKDC